MLGWQQGGTCLFPKELKLVLSSSSQGILLQAFVSILMGPLAYVCIYSFLPTVLYHLSGQLSIGADLLQLQSEETGERMMFRG